MKVCVIGGANIDITAVSGRQFRHGDSNPGRILISHGGVARNIAHNLALLGDGVQLLTVFGNDASGRQLAEGCEKAGIGIRYASFSESSPNSCFVSINDFTGEMLGGVSDMAAIDEMDASWLEDRKEAILEADAVVADANLHPGAFKYLLGIVKAPLYLDAVSGPKAERMLGALVGLGLGRGRIHALKCNRSEASILAPLLPSLQRCYISLGSGGLQTITSDSVKLYSALPCKVRNTTGAGDALLAGIVHAGPDATVEDAAKTGLICAKFAVESDSPVNENLKL